MNQNLLRYMGIMTVLMLLITLTNGITIPESPFWNAAGHVVYFLFLLCFFHMFILPVFGIVCMVKKLYLHGILFIAVPVVFYFVVIGSNWEQF